MDYIKFSHNLLPFHAQRILMDAAQTERLDFIDRAINTVRDVCANKFYTEGERALNQRTFYNEPVNHVPMKGFVVARERRL